MTGRLEATYEGNSGDGTQRKHAGPKKRMPVPRSTEITPTHLVIFKTWKDTRLPMVADLRINGYSGNRVFLDHPISLDTPNLFSWVRQRIGTRFCSLRIGATATWDRRHSSAITLLTS